MTTDTLPMAGTVPTAQMNALGLSKNDYRGNPTTLCQGCGHNSISNQIISALYEMGVNPDNIAKFSGIDGTTTRYPFAAIACAIGAYARGSTKPPG